MAQKAKNIKGKPRSHKTSEKKIEWTDRDLQTTFSIKEPEIIAGNYPLKDPAVFWINEKSVFCRLNWALWGQVKLRRPDQFRLFSNASLCQLIHPVKNAVVPVYHIPELPSDIFKNFKNGVPPVYAKDREAGEASGSKLSFRDECLKQINEISKVLDEKICFDALDEDDDFERFSPIYAITDQGFLLFYIAEHCEPGDLDEIARRLKQLEAALKDTAPEKPVTFGIVCTNETSRRIEGRLKEKRFSFIKIIKRETLKEDLMDVFLDVCETYLESLGKDFNLRYMILDLTNYSIELKSDVPEGGWTDEYKTSKLVLRYIPSGRFMMGSPEDELGRSEDETRHPVTLTQPFFIGVFPLTERQYELITGTEVTSGGPGGKPKSKKSQKVFSMRFLSYDMIRGRNAGSKWPVGKDVDKDSVLGILWKKSKLKFDLPTEAQWEKACRAGTDTAFNNGANITNESHDDNLDPIAHYYKNCDVQEIALDDDLMIPVDNMPQPPKPVGSFLPNAWGLYDMHGNVGEWCLDWYGNLGSAHEYDPEGPKSGTSRVVKGGDWADYARNCRSASRTEVSPDYDKWPEDMEVEPCFCRLIGYGFRLALNFQEFYKK